MTLDPWVLLAITCMALATYLNRAGGYLLFRAMRPPPLVRDMLSYIPGALFVSYVVPALVAGSLQHWAGAAATIILMLLTRQMAVAILGGTAAAWLVWAF